MTVGIRGMGLIGGSFEKAFRKAGHEVLNLKDATPEAVASCGLVVVCSLSERQREMLLAGGCLNYTKNGR